MIRAPFRRPGDVSGLIECNSFSVHPLHPHARPMMEPPARPDGLRIQPAYLRPKRAAAFCGISIRTLWAWVKGGKLRPPYRPSQTVALFDPERLREDIARLGGDK